MAEVNSGLSSVLALARVYNSLQSLVGDCHARDVFVREYVAPGAHESILDIGCGVGNRAPYFPGSSYFGFDPNERYIVTARKKFASCGTFLCATIDTVQERIRNRAFSLVLLVGVLHHMDDELARETIAFAHRNLPPGGRLVTMDACLDGEKRWLARFMITHDRGRNVRTVAGTARLVASVFHSHACRLRADLLRVPYSHVIAIAER